MSMLCVGRFWLLSVLLLVVCGSVSAASPSPCVSSVPLSGSDFQFSDFSDACGLPIFTQQGVNYTAPELRVVANTTVTFTITAHGQSGYPFGLTWSNASSLRAGSPLNLSISPASMSAMSCLPGRGDAYYLNNTFVLNATVNNGQITWSPIPCILTWVVPIPDNNTVPIYYFITGLPPRRIYIVNSTNVLSSSSSSAGASSSSSSSGDTASSSSSSSSGATAAASSSTGSGSVSSSSSSSNPIPSTTSATGSSTSTGTSTGSTSGSSSSPIPTGTSSSSSSSAPNGASVGVRLSRASVAAVAIVVTGAMLSAF